MGGRPAFVPTAGQRQLVKTLATAGIPQERIRLAVLNESGAPICVDTLAKHFREELTVGSIEANLKVARALFQAAMSGDVTAQIFWLKTRAGWSEKAPRLELLGPRQMPTLTVIDATPAAAGSNIPILSRT